MRVNGVASDDAAAIVADAVKVLRAYKLEGVADLAEAKLDPNRQLRTVVVAQV